MLAMKNIWGVQKMQDMVNKKKQDPEIRNLKKSSPPISRKSPKYADHPPNAGHGFAAHF